MISRFAISLRAPATALASGVALFTAPAFADVRDVRASQEDGLAVIEIDFAEPVRGARAAASPDGVLIEVAGVSGRERVWDVRSGQLVRGFRVRQAGDGLVLDLDVTGGVVSARATASGATVRIETRVAERAPGAESAGSRSGGELLGGPVNSAAVQGLDDEAARVRRAAELAAAQDAISGDATPSLAPDLLFAALQEIGKQAPRAAAAPMPLPHRDDTDHAAESKGSDHGSASPEVGAHGPGEHEEASLSDDKHAETHVDADASAPTPSPTLPPLSGGGSVAAAAAPSFAASGPMRRFAGGVTQEDCDAADAAVRADPWDLERLESHGACLALLGRATEAVDVFERLLTFSPDDAELHLGLGAALEETGDLKAARLSYDDALRRASSDAEAARARALIDASGSEP